MLLAASIVSTSNRKADVRYRHLDVDTRPTSGARGLDHEALMVRSNGSFEEESRTQAIAQPHLVQLLDEVVPVPVLEHSAVWATLRDDREQHVVVLQDREQPPARFVVPDRTSDGVTGLRGADQPRKRLRRVPRIIEYDPAEIRCEHLERVHRGGVRQGVERRVHQCDVGELAVLRFAEHWNRPAAFVAKIEVPTRLLGQHRDRHDHPVGQLKRVLCLLVEGVVDRNPPTRPS
jgi:hypothetical protein